MDINNFCRNVFFPDAFSKIWIFGVSQDQDRMTCEEVVLPYFRERVEGINHPGTAVLLELVERELAIRDPGHHSNSPELL